MLPTVTVNGTSVVTRKYRYVEITLQTLRYIFLLNIKVEELFTVALEANSSEHMSIVMFSSSNFGLVCIQI